MSTEALEVSTVADHFQSEFSGTPPFQHATSARRRWPQVQAIEPAGMVCGLAAALAIAHLDRSAIILAVFVPVVFAIDVIAAPSSSRRTSLRPVKRVVTLSTALILAAVLLGNAATHDVRYAFLT